MPAGTTTTVQVDPEVSLFFDNILLDRHQPFYVHGYMAQERRIPQKNSKTAIFRRFDNLSDALTPLNIVGGAKSSLIDLEGRQADKGQALLAA